ncbi:MAG: hypothetical protein KatS3mg101_1148 [Patescibacteria group bacterium]|nr:MAG: hypothetical protein KatS3mg101_1148 [Patescibacteria group bacterium]
MFKLSNIRKHILSTFIAVFILLLSIFFVMSGIASLSEAMPLFTISIPFLLYGPKKEKNAENS